MKTSVIFILLLFCCGILHAEKRALIIAVGDYPESGLWDDLSSENDAQYIKKALLNRGFPKENIQTILNESATRKGILNAIDELQNKCQKGDIVYIHFSGHGQQIIDDNGDEIDGLDEAIVPYDSPMYYKKGSNEGQFLIRDDEIGDFTKSIRRILSTKGQVILVLDSCHSGTGTRGQATVRGTNVLMAPSNFEATKPDSSYGINKKKQEKNLAPMASFFAAAAHEANFESDGVGSLSFAFARVLNNLNQAISIEELFDRIKLKMAFIAPNQHPQMEGVKDCFLFNTEDVATENFYGIEEIISSKRVRASFGILHGIPEGSLIEVISLDQNKTISRGKVTASSLHLSEMKLDESIPTSGEELLKIKVVSKATAPIQCKLKIEVEAGSIWDEVIDGLRTKKIFIETEDYIDLFLSICEDDGLLELRSKEGDLIIQTNPEKSAFYNTRKFAEQIISFSQSNFLRQYQLDSKVFYLNLELIPVRAERVGGELKAKEKLPIEAFKNTNGTLQFKPGDSVQFKITNTGNRPAYYSILDIQPDHQIALLVPNPEGEAQASDFFLKVGETKILKTVFQFGEPYGRDMLKIIATNQALDLGDILNNNGIINRGPNDPATHSFEQLFSYSYQNEDSRGTNTPPMTTSNVGVTSLIYEIVE